MTLSVLPTKIAKRIRGECLYSGCRSAALADSDYCGPHDAHERARVAKKQARYRERLATSGLCFTGCGRKVGKQRSSTVALKRCRQCTRELREAARARRSVTGDICSVTGDRPKWRVDPATNHLRYRGRAKRGRLTREDQINEDIRDVTFAREELDKLARGIEQLKRPELMTLPTIQRDAARRELQLFIGSAARFLDELADKYR